MYLWVAQAVLFDDRCDAATPARVRAALEAWAAARRLPAAVSDDLRLIVDELAPETTARRPPPRFAPPAASCWSSPPSARTGASTTTRRKAGLTGPCCATTP
jgi:hypothetical protein